MAHRDASMVVESSDGAAFIFSEVTLREESEYFRALLDSGMTESLQRRVALPCVSSRGLDLIHKYVTSSDREICPAGANDEFESLCDDVEAINAGNYLQMSAFLKIREKCMIGKLSPDNVFEIRHIAETYDLKNLSTYTENYLYENISTIWCTPRFFEEYADPIKLISLLDKDDLMLSSGEYDVFLIVTAFIDRVKDHEAAHTNFHTLLNCVRFPLMKAKDFKMCTVWLEKFKRDHSNLNLYIKIIADFDTIFHKASSFFENRTLLYTTWDRWTKMRRGRPALMACGGFTQSENSTNKMMYITLENLRNSCKNLQSVEFAKVASREQHLPIRLVEHGACVVNGCLYVAGGQTRYCQDGRYTTNRAYRFDPRDNLWTELASMSEGRSLFYLGELAGYMYAVCGWKGPNSVTKSVERYNVRENYWVQVASCPMGLHEHAGCSHQGHLYVSGGYRGPFRGHLHQVWRYDPNTTFWNQRASLTHKRSYHAMASIGDKIFVAGGVNYIGSDTFEDVMIMELYDPLVDQWSDVDLLPRPANCMSYSVLDHKLLLFGGHSFQDDNDHNMLQVYDTETREVTECVIKSNKIQYFPIVELPLYKVDCY